MMHIIAIFLKMAKSIMKMNIVQLFIIATIILMWHQSITVVRHVCVWVSECVSVFRIMDTGGDVVDVDDVDDVGDVLVCQAVQGGAW